MPSMFKLFDRRARTAPSQYPRGLFHGIRFFQLLASLIVGIIMIYFSWHLGHDHRQEPWVFIWLVSASLFSVVALAGTIVLHCCVGLNPKLNLGINAGLFLLWALSWSLLTYWSGKTLRNYCDVEHWTEDAGIMVCRLYKTLWAFTSLGFLATTAALVLDVHVFRKHTHRGEYKRHSFDAKGRSQGARDGAAFANPRESTEWEAPRSSMGPYGSEERTARGGHEYRVPENQFEYDTSYNGHGAERQKLYGDA